MPYYPIVHIFIGEVWNMKVIITQPYPKLGNAGDIVEVKDGFARNFLIPKKIAIPANEGNLKQVEQIKRKQMTIEQKLRAKLSSIAEQLSRTSIDLIVEVDEKDKLFGTISQTQIAEALAKQGFEIDRKQIIIEEPIETLGVYNVKIQLHPDISSVIRVWVLKHEK